MQGQSGGRRSAVSCCWLISVLLACISIFLTSNHAGTTELHHALLKTMLEDEKGQAAKDRAHVCLYAQSSPYESRNICTERNSRCMPRQLI